MARERAVRPRRDLTRRARSRAQKAYNSGIDASRNSYFKEQLSTRRHRLPGPCLMGTDDSEDTPVGITRDTESVLRPRNYYFDCSRLSTDGQLRLRLSISITKDKFVQTSVVTKFLLTDSRITKVHFLIGFFLHQCGSEQL